MSNEITAAAAAAAADCIIKDGRRYLLETIRVTGPWGAGLLAYLGQDGWVGIQLDGEERIDEYPAEQISLA